MNPIAIALGTILIGIGLLTTDKKIDKVGLTEAKPVPKDDPTDKQTDIGDHDSGGDTNDCAGEAITETQSNLTED